MFAFLRQPPCVATEDFLGSILVVRCDFVDTVCRVSRGAGHYVRVVLRQGGFIQVTRVARLRRVVRPRRLVASKGARLTCAPRIVARGRVATRRLGTFTF